MSAGDPNAIYQHSVVMVRIIKADYNTYWYAGMVGQTIKADKTVTTYTDKPDVYVKYQPFGDRTKHLFINDIEEVEPPKHNPRKSKKKKGKGKKR